jgi:hypothetical protein
MLGQEPPIHRRSTTAVRRPDRDGADMLQETDADIFGFRNAIFGTRENSLACQ